MQNQNQIIDPVERVTTIFKEAGEQWTDFLTMNLKACTVCSADSDIVMFSPELV